jgi:predicted GH43/DUF377 family glycosyl hydrolase
MNPLSLYRHDLNLSPESSRVIIRPFIPSDSHRITTVIGRALALTESELSHALAELRSEFDTRHFDIESVLLHHYQKVLPHVFTERKLSRNRRLLIGALFSGEYALESAALFNPSIVPHPDQTDVPEGGLRFVMSLRATGEGHVSSIEFRSGMIDAQGEIAMDDVSRFLTVPEVLPNPRYFKKSFATKLHEMCPQDEFYAAVMAPLGTWFTLNELKKSIAYLKEQIQPNTMELTRVLERIQWLAESNYELRFPPHLAMSERIIFPVSPNESNGIEDARFVRFTDDDGSMMYYATYTAYNGRAILPQMIETHDFLDFRILTLNGSSVQNKGMALFPRKVNGQYLMLSRQDDENLYLMRSNDPHHWQSHELLMRPAHTWESVKIGNCGSPIETDDGWLVITHGVGPMRKYCIGAALLDLNDPCRVIGRLSKPLLAPEGNEREGYVPNVVYSCGALVHNGRLVLPYAMSDKASAVVSLPLEALIAQLKQGR